MSLLVGTALLSGVSFLPLAPLAHAADAPAPDQSAAVMAPSDQVDFTAAALTYDETGQIITAEGDVEITQNGKILRAEKVVYNLPQDTIEALGKVTLLEESGNVYFADHVTLDKKMKNGFAKKIRAILADGARLTAEEGTRTDDEKTTLKMASYTPCEPCKLDPSKPPLWQITADKVTHSKSQHSLEYEDAQLEVYGVPIVYAPYFTHSDGTIKQKDGFLPPKFSLNSQLGFGVSNSYYWGLSPSADATLGAKIFTQETPQLFGEIRKRFNDAELELKSSLTYSEDDDRMRGHFSGEGLWDIDKKWRAGFQSEIASDDKYLRQYDITSKDVLTNELYAERFDQRDYFSARALAFQDVRVSDTSTDQPNVLPEITASFIGEPIATLGGRWSADLSMLSLVRKGNGQDVTRLSGDLGWKRRDILPLGIVNEFNISAQNDIYTISDRNESISAGADDGSQAYRFYPQVHNVTSLPFIKPLDDAHMAVEPTFAISASTRTKNDTEIPNEDSQDAQIDVTNIFEANRFPGIDRVENKSRITYGLRTGYYTNDGSTGEAFLGQSYRLDDEDNPFPEGSGLSAQHSDIVGQILADYQKRYTFLYRFQMDSDSLRSQRHEINGEANFGDLSLAATYLYARALEGTEINQSRQQVYGNLSYGLTPEWTLSSAARYDLSETEEGLRYTDIGLNYLGQCVSVSAQARKNFTNDDTGDNATEITVQLGLKNLGSIGNAE